MNYGDGARQTSDSFLQRGHIFLLIYSVPVYIVCKFYGNCKKITICQSVRDDVGLHREFGAKTTPMSNNNVPIIFHFICYGSFYLTSLYFQQKIRCLCNFVKTQKFETVFHVPKWVRVCSVKSCVKIKLSFRVEINVVGYHEIFIAKIEGGICQRIMRSAMPHKYDNAKHYEIHFYIGEGVLTGAKRPPFASVVRSFVTIGFGLESLFFSENFDGLSVYLSRFSAVTNMNQPLSISLPIFSHQVQMIDCGIEIILQFRPRKNDKTQCTKTIFATSLLSFSALTSHWRKVFNSVCVVSLI